MEMKTKFSVGDKVFYMKDNRVQNGEVTGIHIFVRRDGIDIITYVYPGDSSGYTEDLLFSSKEELLKSL